MDKNKLLAYLYSELTNEERKEVEQYFAEHPNSRVELNELMETRSILKNFKAKKVVTPTFIFSNKNGSNTQHTIRRRWQNVASVAAVLLAILMVGVVVSRTSISYTNKAFTIAFGQESLINNEQQSELKRLTKQSEQQALFNAKTAQLAKQLASWQETIQALKQQENSIALTKQDLINFKNDISAENAEALHQATQLIAQQQQAYTEQLLINFANYLEEQRQADLITIDYSLTSLQENTELLARMIEINKKTNP